MPICATRGEGHTSCTRITEGMAPKAGAKKKPGPLSGSGSAAAARLPPGTWFAGSTRLAAPDRQRQGRSKEGGTPGGGAGGAGAPDYSAYANELVVASAHGLRSGSMLMVDEEVVEVVEVCEAGQQGTKLIVKRACMGTQPRVHAVDASVLELSTLTSHRPGASPSPIVLAATTTEGARLGHTGHARPHLTGSGSCTGELEGGQEQAKGGRGDEKNLNSEAACHVASARITRWFADRRTNFKGGFSIRCGQSQSSPGNDPERYEREPSRDLSLRRLSNPAKSDCALTAPLTVAQEAVRAGMVQRGQMFMYAVKHGHAQTVQKLLAEGVSPNMLCAAARASRQQDAAPECRPMKSMLMLASEHGEAEVAELLLQYNADILSKDEQNQTALTLAKASFSKARRALEEKIKSADAADESACPVIVSDNTDDIQKASSGAGLAEKAGGPISAGRNAVTRYEATVKVLRKGYADIIRRQRRELTDEDSASANQVKDSLLRVAIEEGWVDLLNRVLDTGISPNHSFAVRKPPVASQGPEWRGFHNARSHSQNMRIVTAIQLAACCGHAGIMDALLRKRAIVNNVADLDGCTPLMEAARSGTAQCARLLIEAGVDLEVTCHLGSAAHFAVTHSNAPVLHELIRAGARLGERLAGQHEGDCVQRAWVYTHGPTGKGPASNAGQVLERCHELFQRLSVEGPGNPQLYCYVALGHSMSGPWLPGLCGRICAETGTSQWKWNQDLTLSNTESNMSIDKMAITIEVIDRDQVGSEILIGSMVQCLSEVVSRPDAKLSQVFNLSPASMSSRRQSPVQSPGGAGSPGSKSFNAGTLNAELQVFAGGIHVRLRESEALVLQDRQSKLMADCLKYSALSGWCDVITTCVDKHAADLDTQLDGHRARVPLMYASAALCGPTVRLLCENKANPNAVDSEGVTALMWACAARVISPSNATAMPDAAPDKNTNVRLRHYNALGCDHEAARDATERRLCQLRVMCSKADDPVAQAEDPRIKWQVSQKGFAGNRFLMCIVTSQMALRMQARMPGKSAKRVCHADQSRLNRTCILASPVSGECAMPGP